MIELFHGCMVFHRLYNSSTLCARVYFWPWTQMWLLPITSHQFHPHPNIQSMHGLMMAVKISPTVVPTGCCPSMVTVIVDIWGLQGKKHLFKEKWFENGPFWIVPRTSIITFVFPCLLFQIDTSHRGTEKDTISEYSSHTSPDSKTNVRGEVD